MGKYTDMLLARAPADTTAPLTGPVNGDRKRKLSATERLLALSGEMSPDTVARETTAAAPGLQPGVEIAPAPAPDLTDPETKIKSPWRAVSLPDVQKNASALEKVLSALPAVGRGIAKSTGEALAGKNPFVQEGGRVPFLEGAKDPNYRGFTQVLEDNLPQWKPATVFRMAGGPTPGASSKFREVTADEWKFSTPDELASAHPGIEEREPDIDVTLPTREAVVGLGGLALNIFGDPVTYTGVGGLTRAGRALRVAETDLEVAKMALAGATRYDEAQAATASMTEALDRLAAARKAAGAEGTLPSRGRAAVQLAGRTSPVMAAAPVMGAAETILGRLKQTQVGRGISEVFQPPTERVSPALKGRSARVEAAYGVGKREALRGMADLIDEYPDVYKAVGGDLESFDDALSLAYERSQGRRFDKPLDWLSDAERRRFFETQSDAVRASLEAEGAKRAHEGVDAYLSRADRQRWRQINALLERRQKLLPVLNAPVEYSDQLAQKYLSARERSELGRLQARRAKKEGPIFPPRQRGAGISGPVEGVPAPAAAKAASPLPALQEKARRTSEELQRVNNALFEGATKYAEKPGTINQAFDHADLLRRKQELEASLTETRRAISRAKQRASEVRPQTAGVPPTEAPKVGVERAPRGGLANPREEARILQLEDLAIERAKRDRANSLTKLERGAKLARADAARITARAQMKVHAQAMRNSILTARRMYYRGASPEAERVFGQFAEKMIGRLNARTATMFSETTREGVRLAELADPMAYMLHATTPEAQKAILEAAVERGEITRAMGWREFTEKHASQMTRKLRMTATEANRLAAQGKLSIVGGRKVKQFFYTNPLIAQTMREAGAKASQGYARFLREAAYTYGKPARLAPKGWRAVPNEVEGIGDKILFEPEVADLLTRHHQALRDPAGVLDAYDRITQIWKAYTLGIFPVYHVRNELGDFWNAVVLGGLDPKYVGTAMDELLYGSKFAEAIGHTSKGLTVGGKRFAPGQLRDEAEAMGVMESNQIQQELEQNVLGPLRQRTSVRKALKEEGLGAGLDMAQRKLTDNRAIEAATAIGNSREQAFRLALYIDRRARGWSPESSAMWVKKHLIDYGQLSDTERNLIRRVLPFYTWTRHNAPLQLEYLFAKPGAFAAAQKGRESAAGEEPLGLGGTPLPSFLEEGVPLSAGRSETGARQFMRLEGTWPGADALTVVSPLTDPEAAAKRGMSMLNPMLSEALEQGTGIDFWRSRPGKAVPIERFPGEEGTFLGVPMPERTSHALSNLRPLTELDRLNPGNVFGTDTKPGPFGQVRENPQIDEGLRWLNVFIGRGYSVDEARVMADHARAVKRALSTLENEIAYAEKRGQTAKAASARRRYQYLLEHPEAVSPDMPK